MLTFMYVYVYIYIVHILDKNNKTYKMNGVRSLKITGSRVAQGKYQLAVWVMQYGPSLKITAREILLLERSLSKLKFQILKSNNLLLQLLDV